MSSSPEFTELQVHTGKCLPAIPRLHYDPKLPKWVVPKPGFPDSVPAHACQRSGVGLYAHRHLLGETLPQPLLVLQGPGLTPQSGHPVPPPRPSANACLWLLPPVGQEGDSVPGTLAQCWPRSLQRGPACWGPAPRRNNQNRGLQTALSLPVTGHVSFPSNSSRLRGTEADYE